MDRDRASLQDIVANAELALNFLHGITKQEFLRDKKLKLAVERLMEIIGEAAGRVSPAARERLDVDWRGLRGLRNVVAHQYEFVDHGRLLHFIHAFLPKTVATIKASLEAP